MNDKKPFRFKFFPPDARVLSESEIDSLPAGKLQSVKAAGRDGRITLPVQKSKEEGTFLDLFRPEGSCEIVQSTDLP